MEPYRLRRQSDGGQCVGVPYRGSQLFAQPRESLEVVPHFTSALLKHGIEILKVVRANLSAWMEAHEYTSIRQMQGSMSSRSVVDPAAFERANYMRVLSSYVLRG